MDNMKTEVELVMVLGFVLMFAITGFVVFFVIRYRQKQREHLLEKQKMETKFHEDVMQIKIELSEELLQKLSMEIHDNVCQSLTLAKIQLSMMDEKTLENTRNNGIELIGRALSDLRNMAYSMKGINFKDSGFLKALEKEVQWISSPGQRVVQTNWTVAFPEITHEKQLVLFRSVQELLNNCAKHSGATGIYVSLERKGNEFTLEVKDNGTGIGESMTKGLGLNNVSERMALIGGRAVFQNDPLGGLSAKLIFTHHASPNQP